MKVVLRHRCYWYTGSGRNTRWFGKTVVSGTVGMGNLYLSALLARLKAFHLPWSTGLYSIGLLLWRCISKTMILSWLRGYFIGTSIFIGTSVPSRSSLRLSQKQGVRKETKGNGGFETEHQGRSGSNFSQHAAISDALLPEMLGGMCWQGMPPHRHYIQEVNVVIKMLWVKDNFSNKFA
jgi:hypothetical protein